MVPNVSMCHTQQFCGWDIAHKRLGPPGTIHVVHYSQELRRQRIAIFASNACEISEDHPQKQSQEHKNVITPEYLHRPCVIITGDLHCVADDRIEAPSWIGSGGQQGPTWLRYNAFPFSICLTQDFSISKAVKTLPRPAYSSSGTSSSFGETPRWFPDKITKPTSRNHGEVMPGNPGGLGWHPLGKN